MCEKCLQMEMKSEHSGKTKQSDAMKEAMAVQEEGVG